MANCLAANHLIATSDRFPYNASGAGGACPYTSDGTPAGSFVFEKVGRGAGVTHAYAASGEDAIKKTLDYDGACGSLYSPAVASCIDANHQSFQLYRSGVYAEPSCTKTTTHCISVWGFGTTDDGEDFWILKNSWGASWGLGGYMHMQRGVQMCAIGSYDSYYFFS